jgi:hypothetical protein
MNTNLPNVAHVDVFTLGHAALGFGAARLGVSLAAAAVLAIGFELMEDRLKTQFPVIFPRASPDSKPNALTDVLAVVAGHVIGTASK